MLPTLTPGANPTTPGFEVVRDAVAAVHRETAAPTSVKAQVCPYCSPAANWMSPTFPLTVCGGLDVAQTISALAAITGLLSAHSSGTLGTVSSPSPHKMKARPNEPSDVHALMVRPGDVWDADALYRWMMAKGVTEAMSLSQALKGGYGCWAFSKVACNEALKMSDIEAEFHKLYPTCAASSNAIFSLVNILQAPGSLEAVPPVPTPASPAPMSAVPNSASSPAPVAAAHTSSGSL